MCGLDKNTSLTVFFDISPSERSSQPGQQNPHLYIQFVTRYFLLLSLSFKYCLNVLSELIFCSYQHPEGQMRIRVTTICRKWVDASTNTEVSRDIYHLLWRALFESKSDNTILCIRVCICMILVQCSNFFYMIFLLLTVNISCLMRYYLCFLLKNALSLIAVYCIIMMVKFMYSLLLLKNALSLVAAYCIIMMAKFMYNLILAPPSFDELFLFKQMC
jgi:hypothetical protein